MHFHHDTSFDPKSSHVGNIALTTSIPSDIEEHIVFLKLIGYTKSKKEFKKKKKKPCNKIEQFFVGLHC